MIPVQDVIPSGRLPLATLGLLLLNLLSCAVHTADASAPVPGIFVHSSMTSWIVAIWFLWLFGDNVEARLGRITLVAIYIVCGLAASYLSRTLMQLESPPEGVGSAGAIAGVLGAYFLLLPHSRVLMLVPAPLSLVEVPAMFFLGLWWLLQFLTFVVGAPSARLLPGAGVAMGSLAAALGTGAAIGFLMRQPITWR